MTSSAAEAIVDKIMVKLTILCIIEVTIANIRWRFGPPEPSPAFGSGLHDHWMSVNRSDEKGGGDMATTTLSTKTITEMVQKLGGLALSPSELEGLAPQLETLFRDIQTLESLDLGEVEPETLFDIQGE